MSLTLSDIKRVNRWIDEENIISEEFDIIVEYYEEMGCSNITETLSGIFFMDSYWFYDTMEEIEEEGLSLEDYSMIELPKRYLLIQ